MIISLLVTCPSKKVSINSPNQKSMAYSILVTIPHKK
jgi:hypothetical protein